MPTTDSVDDILPSEIGHFVVLPLLPTAQILDELEFLAILFAL